MAGCRSKRCHQRGRSHGCLVFHRLTRASLTQPFLSTLQARGAMFSFCASDATVFVVPTPVCETQRGICRKGIQTTTLQMTHPHMTTCRCKSATTGGRENNFNNGHPNTGPDGIRFGGRAMRACSCLLRAGLCLHSLRKQFFPHRGGRVSAEEMGTNATAPHRGKGEKLE